MHPRTTHDFPMLRAGLRLRAAGCFIALVLCLTAVDMPAFAARFEIQAGSSFMDSHPATALFAESTWASQRIGDTRSSWSPDVSAGWIDGRDISRYRGSQYTTYDTVWLLGAGARFHYSTAGGGDSPLFFSFQTALQGGRTQALSSAYEFISTVGWQGQRFSFQLRHVSNGGLHGPNRGESMALVGIGFDL